MIVLRLRSGDAVVPPAGAAARHDRLRCQNRHMVRWVSASHRALSFAATRVISATLVYIGRCLFYELLTRGQILFPGNNTEMDQLNRIFEVETHFFRLLPSIGLTSFAAVCRLLARLPRTTGRACPS